MVVRSASAVPAFAPGEPARVAVAPDGGLAAVVESTRVVVLELPACTERAEIGIDPEAGASDVAWIGARLAVLARYAAHSTVHLVDPVGPSGPRTIAEIRLEAPMKLYAAVGAYALAVGALGAAVIAAGESHLTPYQFPARTVPVAAGAAGSQFVVALAGGGAVEEWDPQSRMPKRRIKLARPSPITAVGGSERVVWMTTQSDPTRLDVVTFVNRGQPKTHELPEPIAYVASHPRSDLVVCLGADTRTLYTVDLDGKAPLRTLGVDGIDRVDGTGLVVGRVLGVLAAQARRPVSIVMLDGHGDAAPLPAAQPQPPARPDESPLARSTLSGDDEPPAAASVTPPVAPPPVLGPDPRRKPSLHRVAKLATGARPAAPATPAPSAPPQLSQSLAAKFAAWRERTRAAHAATTPTTALDWLDARPSWRDELHAWTRAVAVGGAQVSAGGERAAPPAPLVDLVIERFGLPAQLAPALALLYGAHLAGEPGAAPVDVARVLGRRWDEALGRGRLAALGLATYRDSRVRLAPAVQRVLDELPPETGVLVGTPGPIALLGPCAVVAPPGPLAAAAEACLPLAGGAILAAHVGAPPDAVLAEARAFGAVAMLRALPAGFDAPAIVAAADGDAAAALGLPRLA